MFVHCTPGRSRDRLRRYLLSRSLAVGPIPRVGPELILWLQPDGYLLPNSSSNGKSRTGRRAIDLRVGDELYVRSRSALKANG
jgi:hypothetical protein